jgi:hypothetical protein
MSKLCTLCLHGYPQDGARNLEMMGVCYFAGIRTCNQEARAPHLQVSRYGRSPLQPQ